MTSAERLAKLKELKDADYSQCTPEMAECFRSIDRILIALAEHLGLDKEDSIEEPDGRRSRIN
jgi:hypothetical protein